jgi:hypothetical protein
MADTYKQGTVLVVRVGIEYVNPGSGRRNRLKVGARMWTASCNLSQLKTGVVELCGMGKPMGSGLLFPLATVAQYFEIEN